MKRVSILLLLLCFPLITFGQTFFNGSFENNSVTNCMINNMTNLQFNALMNDVKGIGLEETIDIFQDTNCQQYGFAQNGNFFVSLENNNQSDLTLSTAISLKLTNNIQQGYTYNLSFYDRGLSAGNGPIVIGVSQNDNSFGSVIYTTPLVTEDWTLRTVTFTAPITAGYITAKYGALLGGAFIDSFNITSVLGTENQTDIQKLKVFPNPFSNQITFTTSNNEQTVISLYDFLGQQILQQPFLNSTTINTEQLSIGIYFYELKTSERIIANGKVIKN